MNVSVDLDAVTGRSTPSAAVPGMNAMLDASQIILVHITLVPSHRQGQACGF